MAQPYFDKKEGVWKITYVKPDGKRSKKTLGKSKTAAFAKWKAMGEIKANPRATQVVEKYLAWVNEQLTMGLVSQGHVQSVTITLNDAIGDIRWSQLTPEYLSNYASTKGWAPDTIRTRFTHLRRLSRWAARSKGLPDILDGLRRPKAGRRLKAVTREEWHALNDHIFRNNRTTDHRISLLLALLWHTGARPGELFRAKWSDVQGDKMVFAQHKNARRTGKMRVIFLNPSARVVIEHCRGLHKEHVFIDARGNAWTKDTCSARIRRMTKAAKLDKSIVAYSFRHAYATRALLKGVDVAMLATLMGTSIAMIERHYGHLSKAADRLMEQAKRI